MGSADLSTDANRDHGVEMVRKRKRDNDDDS
jgi:hypothetical protein